MIREKKWPKTASPAVAPHGAGFEANHFGSRIWFESRTHRIPGRGAAASPAGFDGAGKVGKGAVGRALTSCLLAVR